MSGAFTFNSVDFSAYGLVVNDDDSPTASRDIKTSQVLDTAYASIPLAQPKQVKLNVKVSADDLTTLTGYCDTIKRLLLLHKVVKELKLDTLSGRYFNALCISVDLQAVAPKVVSGSITFLCADPRAYAVTPTSSDHTIDADPKTITETPGGSAYIEPVWTLTAGETLSSATISLANETTGETMTLTISMVDEDVLVINSQTWEVTLNGTNVMADLASTHQFPQLSPSVANTITVTGFGTTGTLKITYRDTYA
jgi:phage-related protein